MKKLQFSALKISSLYLLIGTAWIFSTDNVLLWLSNELELFSILQLYKGFLYVFFTTVLLFILLRRHAKKIKYLVFHDRLTDLPNRYMLKGHLEQMMSDGTLTLHQIAVLMVDIKRFNEINTLGDFAGDKLLQLSTMRMKQCMEVEDFIGRYGSNEFGIILENGQKDNVMRVANEIMKNFSRPFKLGDEDIYATPGIGISFYTHAGQNSDALLHNAEIALNMSKELGKNDVQVYTDLADSKEKILQKVRLESDLRKALEKEEFVLYYQPQVDLVTGSLVGLEALVRWNKAEQGLVSPMEFIPLAEETGIIIPLGRWVLEEACKQNKMWHDLGFERTTVSINVSAIQLMDDSFISTVKEILTRTNLEPRYLNLEITERVMPNYDQFLKIFNELKLVGVQISIDDFGKEYSSLNLLRTLPVDYIKIDKIFIRDSSPIVKSIIDIGDNLSIHVIAEGIEEKQQIDFLLQHKCKLGQGYFYSRPVPA